MCLLPYPSFAGLVYGAIAFSQRMTLKPPLWYGEEGINLVAYVLDEQLKTVGQMGVRLA